MPGVQTAPERYVLVRFTGTGAKSVNHLGHGYTFDPYSLVPLEVANQLGSDFEVVAPTAGEPIGHIAGIYDVDNSATGKTIGKIPAGCMVTSYHLTKPEAFTAASTVDIGWTGATDAIVASATVSPTDTTAKSGVVAVETGTTDRTVIWTVTEGGAAGRCNIVIFYVSIKAFGLTPTVA